MPLDIFNLNKILFEIFRINYSENNKKGSNQTDLLQRYLSLETPWVLSQVEAKNLSITEGSNRVIDQKRKKDKS